MFVGASDVEWQERREVRSWDAAGERDMGNVDALYRAGDWLMMQGDWGRVQLRARAICVAF